MIKTEIKNFFKDIDYLVSFDDENDIIKGTNNCLFIYLDDENSGVLTLNFFECEITISIRWNGSGFDIGDMYYQGINFYDFVSNNNVYPHPLLLKTLGLETFLFKIKS